MSLENAAVYFAKWLTLYARTHPPPFEVFTLYQDLNWVGHVQRFLEPGLKIHCPTRDRLRVERVDDRHELADAVVQMTLFRWQQFQPHSLEWPVHLDALEAERVADVVSFLGAAVGLKASAVQNPGNQQCLIQVDPDPTRPRGSHSAPS